MKFLDDPITRVKLRRSELLLDLYELIHQSRGSCGRVSLKLWAEIRRHENKAAALRDLYRTKELLEGFSAKLPFGTDDGGGFLVDLRDRGLRGLVDREVDEATSFLESWKNGRKHQLSCDDDTNASGTCLNCGEASRLPIEELLSRRRHGASMRELSRDFHVHYRRLRVILRAAGLQGKHGGREVEARRTKEQVDKATAIARSGGAFKVKVIEIAVVLECSQATAARFIKRARGGRMSSEDKGVR